MKLEIDGVREDDRDRVAELVRMAVPKNTPVHFNGTPNGKITAVLNVSEFDPIAKLPEIIPLLGWQIFRAIPAQDQDIECTALGHNIRWQHDRSPPPKPYEGGDGW